MCINTITTIFAYDKVVNRSKWKKHLVLSFDMSFKEAIKKSLTKGVDHLFVTFAEHSVVGVDDFEAYVIFFMKIMKEIEYVYIDCNFYSPGLAMLQSAALQSTSVKNIYIYAETPITENYRIISEDRANNSMDARESVISRQRLYDLSNSN